jgi:plastocyanin
MAAVVVVVLAAGAASVLYLPQLLTPKSSSTLPIRVVYVGMNSGAQNLTSRFLPGNVTVLIGVNNTVRWTNNDQYPTPIQHTLTEGKPERLSVTVSSCTIPVKAIGTHIQCPTTTPLFDSGDLQKNDTFMYTFTSPGVYEYFCVYHPGMIGFVIVKR